jgi:hypothetical protein
MSGINSYAFCGDYSSIASCLFAIQATDDSGGFADDAEAQLLLGVFEGDLLRKLYNRTMAVLYVLEGTPELPADFLGDFEILDFSGMDFNVGYKDQTNNGYSSTFQTILNVFAFFCSQSSAISSANIQGLNTVFVPVLDAFTALQNYLVSAGLSPCQSMPVYFNNSRSLYLQAAGSDGTNGIAEGIHLRWGLTGDLGYNHLPQGGYYPASFTPSGYNKTDDYVQLRRTPYVNPVIFTVDFEVSLPAIDYAAFRWTYVMNWYADSQQITNVVRLSFLDQPLYNQIAAVTDPNANYFLFLQSYNGLLDVAVDNKTCFSFGYDFRLVNGAGSASLRLDAFSISEVNGASAETLNIRQTVAASVAGPVTGTVSGDNIQQVQLQQSSGGFLQSISFETYDDFQQTRATTDWVEVGTGFALSTDQSIVYGQLEAPAYPIDHLWPQYNNGTTVKVANYQDKWSVDRTNDPAVLTMVTQYLTLAATDPRAEDVVMDEGSPAGTTGLLVSYVDVLNMLAMDYHWARMLGLGYIDTANIGSPAVRFIYQVSYVNTESLTSPVMLTYQFASLPTAILDARLPLQPGIQPLAYALPSNNGLSQNQFDSQGYAINSNVRVVNIARQLYNYELSGTALSNNFSAAGDFNIFENIQAVHYGIDYRPFSQSNYQKPGITNNPQLGFQYYAYDTDNPVTGVPETVPVPDNPQSLYVHMETQTGVHAYAIYGIDWFSRASVISSEADTDDTEFPAQNTLTPPSAVTVQYIQEEDTLVFTTAQEQTWLSGRTGQFPGQDVNFTRLTFNWLDITDLSYVKDFTNFNYAAVLKPTGIKPYFNPAEPLQVAGLITSVQAVADDSSLLMLNTGSYNLLDGTLVSPVIASGDIARFNGSLLITADGQFGVQSVVNATTGPVFTIQKISQTNTVEDPQTAELYGTVSSYISPSARSMFTVTENLADPANWQPVTESVQLVDFGELAAPLTETSTDAQGNVATYLIGGISGNAVVSQLLSTVDQSVMPGYYSASFDSTVHLAPHPQVNLPFDPANPTANNPGTLQSPYVLWYNGLIRIPLADGSGDMKLLEVITIIQTSPLIVYLYDADFTDNPIQVSASSSAPIANVNFHPGYKVYLFPEPSPGAFNGANILPAGNTGSKKSLMGLQSTDTGAGGSGFVSAVSPPVILLARRIFVPVQLAAPLTYGLVVRPDATAKAAFTFDLVIGPDSTGAAQSPFGFMFYRTTNEDVLTALYAPATVTTILAALAGLTADTQFNQRYAELVNLTYNGSPGEFNIYNGYGFPVPDNPGLTADGDSPEVLNAKYQAAILSTILPLTAQVPVYAFIKQGLQTANSLPVIRTADGNLLAPTDPAFDPFPMIRQYTNAGQANTAYIRFTDYTLNGASRFLYFYSGAEVTNQLAVGPLSPFAGPVSILNVTPADAPLIRYFTLGPPAAPSSSPVAVTFYITPFSPEDPIGKVAIYRTYDQSQTVSLQSMAMQTEVSVAPDPVNGIVVTDTFADLPAIPYGEVIYYRLAFIRTIINERNVPEDVTGLGSDTIIITMTDTVNPVAPAITYTPATSELSWLPSANKGTYYLYQQNSKGNWQNIYTVQPSSQTAAMTFTISPPLVLTDASGNRIYYRYKVTVQNSSGLFNLADNQLTI